MLTVAATHVQQIARLALAFTQAGKGETKKSGAVQCTYAATCGGHKRLTQRRDHLFQLAGIDAEGADAFGQLLRRHRVFIHHETEGFFVERHVHDVGRWRRFGAQLALHGGIAVGQLLQQVGADGEQVAAGQFEDLRGVAEARAHHLGLVAELAVVVVDAPDRLHARVFRAHVVDARRFLVPVVDAADEGRNQLRARFGAGDGLRQREQQGHVAADAFLFQDGGGADAFPGGGDLDQHALAGNAGVRIQGDQVAALGDCTFRVERQAGIDFGRDAAGDDLQDFLAKRDQQAVDDFGIGGIRMVAHGLFQQRLVFILLHGLQDQRRVRRRVARRVGLNRLEVAGVGHHGSKLLQLFELVHGCTGKSEGTCRGIVPNPLPAASTIVSPAHYLLN